MSDNTKDRLTIARLAGADFSFTPRGREWLAKAEHYVPIQPARIAKMLAEYVPRFGGGYGERAQEAVHCYEARAYVACCAMCGAAAESIMLAVAIAAAKDEAAVLHAYETTNGRSRVDNRLLGQHPEPPQREFRADTALLKYWRDSAAHGKRSGLGKAEAFTSLAMLLRFAQYADQRWDQLVA